MSLANNTRIQAALRRLKPLSDLDETRLAELAGEIRLRHASPGDCVLEMNSEDSRLLLLLEGELELTARDGARRIVRHTDPAATGPVSRLRPSVYRVTARTAAEYLQIEQQLIDTYSERNSSSSMFVDESYMVSEPNELIDDSATHPLMFDVFHDLNHGRIVVPSDPDVAIRVGRSLGALGTDAARLSGILSICPVLMLKVLRAAKAARPERVAIHSGKQAVELLGMDQTETLVINCVLRESLRTRSPTVRNYMSGWWRRAMRVAAISEVLARKDARFDPEYAALIGLLHNIAEPFLLGYADRHPDLADDSALDNLVHQNRAELGRILLSLWGLPKEIVDAAARCNQWDYAGASSAADYTDIVLVAQWHATIGGSRGRWLPAIEDIPAFRRLGLQSATPELGLKIVEAGDQAIKKVDRLLTS